MSDPAGRDVTLPCSSDHSDETHEEPLRHVGDEDVRVSPSGRVIAAPDWAYERGYRYYSQIKDLWHPWKVRRVAEIKRQAAEQREQCEHYARISADPNAPEAQRDIARWWLRCYRLDQASGPDRPAPSLDSPSYLARKRCKQCGDRFFGLGNATTCTPACHEARRKATRTRGEPKDRRVVHEPRPCPNCGGRFTPRRRDAVFCSSRCRIAHHRQD